MKLYVRLEAPFEWVRVSGKIVEAFGAVSGPADFPMSDEDEVIGVVPGEWVTMHRVTLPAKSKRQFLAAAPYALEESISEDVEKLHFVVPHWKSGEECTVMVVARQKMLQWQELANQYQLPLDRLVADHSLLPLHDAADCSIALVNTIDLQQHEILARDQFSGVCIDPDFIDVWVLDLPVSSTIAVNNQELTERLIAKYPDRDIRYWGFGDKLAHWLEHAPSQAYDLFSDEYRPTVRSTSWRAYAAPIMIAVAAVMLVLFYDTYRYFSLHAEIRSIDREQQEIVKSSFPEIDFVEPTKERFIMEQALLRMSGGPQTISMQTMLAEAAKVLKSQRVTLANVVFRESKLVITCQLNDFSQVDLLTKQLNARPHITASLQSSAADDDQIVASYTISAS
ncbi:MAG: hypothetical protein HKN85_00920 [Gammaproteobacteria bacterium]|nr:hypothetical protein [Gammaproteobacteria bacterium]